jgi:hypothetical protein
MEDSPDTVDIESADWERHRAHERPIAAIQIGSASAEEFAVYGRRLNLLLTAARSRRRMPVMSISLPTALQDGSDDAAVELVRGYFGVDLSRSGGVAFTGSQFDSWAGGGDKPDVANRFTDADINAVAMLSVEIPPRAVIEVLQRRAGTLSSLLELIPPDVDLHDATAELIGPASSAWKLWEQLDDVRDLGPTTVSKLCARKRPRLLPVHDKYVEQFVGPARTYWEAMRQSLASDGSRLAHRLQSIGQAAGATHLSVLRVFDVIAWRSGNVSAEVV